MSRRAFFPLGATLVLGLLVLSGCQRSAAPASGPKIATTTSYLEAAARDLLGNNLSVVRLAEPGTCPGHFDLRPSQVAELRQCRALLRFDFQKALDAKLAGADTNSPRIAPVALQGGMCRPDSYRAACRQIAEHLVALDLLARTNADTRLQAIASRLDALARAATNRVAQAGLAGSPVIASGHQRDFCEWLGLKVIAAFRAADTASIGEIEAAIDAGKLAPVKLVIANLPEGRRTAEALAERLETRVVVFENFPALREGSVSFDAMLAANLEALLRAAAKAPAGVPRPSPARGHSDPRRNPSGIGHSCPQQRDHPSRQGNAPAAPISVQDTGRKGVRTESTPIACWR